jgi:hypothetical protein
LLVIIGLFAWVQRRRPSARFLVACFGVAVLLSLGGQLTIHNEHYVWLPWSILEGHAPFNNVLTERMAVYASLAAAVIVAVWVSSRRSGWLRFVLPALAVVSILPDLWTTGWATTYRLPPFFTDAAYRNCIDPGENILPLPVSGDGVAMLWQVKRGFRFSMAGGYLAFHPPASFIDSPAVAQIANGGSVPASQSDVMAKYIADKHVTTAVLDSSQFLKWSSALDKLAPSHEVGGVYFYRFTQFPPTCPGA